MREDWWVEEKQLDEDQKKVILLPPEGSYLLTGPPGSGKSNLLLLRAKYLVKSGLTNLSVLVFTKSLCKFLISGAALYEFDIDKLSTYMKWGKKFLHVHYDNDDLSNNFRDARFELLDRMTSIIEKKGFDRMYDTILLDEGQDYMPEEILMVRKMCKDLFIVADSKQKIYGEDDSMEEIMKAVGGNELKLKHHYRNGTAICAVADELGRGLSNYTSMSDTCNYNEKEYKSEVNIITCSDMGNLADLLITRLYIQLKAYPDSNIGVLCPTNKDLEQVWNLIKETDIAEHFEVQTKEGELNINANARVYLSTIHSAKGLEFRAAHLICAESLKKFPRDTREISFVAVTRAKTSFTAYHINDMPGYLEAALRKQDPVETIPTIKDVFGDSL